MQQHLLLVREEQRNQKVQLPQPSEDVDTVELFDDFGFPALIEVGALLGIGNLNLFVATHGWVTSSSEATVAKHSLNRVPEHVRGFQHHTPSVG
jgi:hypothetical protein